MISTNRRFRWIVGFPFRALFQANEEGEETVAHEGEGGDAPRRGGFEAVSETMGPIQMDFSLIGDSTHTFLTRKKCVPGNKQAKGSIVIGNKLFRSQLYQQN